MGDLNELQSSDTTKIVGSTPNGTETNAMEVTSNQEATMSDSLNHGGVNSEITVGTTPVELKVGASPLSLRKMISMQARDNNVYFGYNSGVTTANGTEIFKNQFILIPIGPGTQIWIVADANGKKVRIGEIA